MTEPYARTADTRPYTAYALDQITIDATGGGIALTLANVRGASRVLISVETAQIRYTTTSATTVTASVGLLANVGDQIILIGPEIQQFKAIRTGGTSATITVEYSR